MKLRKFLQDVSITFSTHKECSPWHLHIPFLTASYWHSHDLVDGSKLVGHQGMLSQETFQLSMGVCKNSAAPVLSLPDTLQKKKLGVRIKIVAAQMYPKQKGGQTH